MNFFDPERPKGPDGRPRWLPFPSVALPGLYISPSEETNRKVEVSVIVPSSGLFTSHYLTQEFETVFLWELLSKYRDNPEDTLRNYFGWKPEEVKMERRKVVSGKETLSLEDLGI